MTNDNRKFYLMIIHLQVVLVQVSIDKVPEAFAVYTNQTSRPPFSHSKGGDEVVAP